MGDAVGDRLHAPPAAGTGYPGTVNAYIMASEVVSRALAGGYGGLAAVGRLAPQADPAWHGLQRVEGVPYGPLPGQVLDIYRPVDRSGLLPGLLYLHGGGFRAMSRKTHWLLGLAYARRGMVVFLADYRLGRPHPYPIPAEDACAAWAWVAEHAEAWGADPARLGVAGESAGANLAAMVGVASAWSRPEPFARRVYDAPARPRVALPACGILQVSDTARFHRRKRLLPPVRLVIEDVERVYLPGGLDAEVSLADPLKVVESAAPDRPPPAFFLPVGTRDPLLDDTRRMARALRAHGAVAEDRYYPGEVHAFHAFVWRPAAQRCWRETYAFLDQHLGGGAR